MYQLRNGLLTIGIPAYNGGKNFYDLVQSIKKLGLKDDEYEILVVDNCSEDDSEEVLQQLKNTVPNLRYHINKYNIGRIENWNKVIDLALGDYLIIMNVNDRFENFDASQAIGYLNEYQNLSLILTDIQFEDHIYPNWEESGLIDLENYLKETFLNVEYLEFHSVGVLHQHIFRTKTLLENNIRFDPKIPRTTDRVFVAQAVAAYSGCFLYINKAIASWHLNEDRYHYHVHSIETQFNFNELWGNEYEANVQLAGVANISYKQVLRSQLILASFYTHVKYLRLMKDKLLRTHTPTVGMEIPTAAIFYTFLKTMARLNKVELNYTGIKMIALKRAIIWYLRSIGLHKKNIRSLKGIIKQVEPVTNAPLKIYQSFI